MNPRTSRLLKLMALQFAGGALFALILSWRRDWHMSTADFIINVIGFTVTGMLAMHLRETRNLPCSLLRVLDKLESSTLKGITRGLLGLVVSYPMLFLGMVLFALLGLSAPPVDTLPEVAQSVHQAVNVVFCAWLGFGMIFQIVQTIIYGTSSTRAIPLAVRFCEQFLLLAVGQLLVRRFGSDLSAAVVWVKANPDSALAGVAAIIIVRIVLAFAPSPSIVARGSEGGDYAMATMRPRRPREAKDMHRTAVHEAGHLILFADLPETPAELTVKVLSELGSDDNYRGFVTHSSEAWPEVQTESSMKWLMLMHLAGAEAEFAVFGERADGAESDNAKWLNVATTYLSAGFGEVFYASPDGESQIAHNRAVLNDLKAKHVAELGIRFSANKAVLNDLTAAISEKKELGRDEIAPYLAQVVRPD